MKDLWTHRKFILKLLAFAVVFFAINTPVNNAYTRWSRQTLEYEMSRLQFEAIEDQVSVAIIGDSHVRNAIDPQLMAGSYNFAFQGENVIQSYFKIRYYIEKGWRPEVVVLPIDLHSFSSYRSDRVQDLAFWKRYINFWELGWEKGKPHTYLKLRIIGEVAYLGELDEVINNLLHPEVPGDLMAMGFVPRYGELSGKNQERLQRLAAGRAVNHFEGYQMLDPDLLTYFLKLVGYLEDHGVVVVLVRYPVTEWYYDATGAYFSIEDYYSRIGEVLADNENQVIVLNYQDIYWGQEELFVDTDHLNAEGASQLTVRFKEDLDKLGILP